MSDPIKDLLHEVEQELAQIKDVEKREKQRKKIEDLWRKYDGEDRLDTMDSNLKEARMRNAKLREYSTGYVGLNAMLTGFRDTELVVITGPTKNGKTTFAMSLTKNILNEGIIPAWFSFEMGEEEFAEKIGEGVLDKIYAPKKLKTNDLQWIENKVVEGIAKYDAQVFFIDHLHFMTPRGGRDNLSSRIGEAVQGLKNMAKKWNIVIVLLAHTTKIKPTEDPTIASLRDSSFIGQDANTVMYVKRVGDETNYGNKLEVFVIANRRHGRNGKINMVYNHDLLYLEESHDDWG